MCRLRLWWGQRGMGKAIEKGVGRRMGIGRGEGVWVWVLALGGEGS